MEMEKKCPYINRDDVAQMLIEGVLEDNSSPQYAEYIRLLVYSVPSADVAPVRHGHWMKTGAYPHRVYCSVCSRTYAQAHWEVWKDGSLARAYCPNCGAKMDSE